MDFRKFYSKLNESVDSTFLSFGRTVHYTQDKTVVIDGKVHNIKFNSLEEAKEYCKQQYIDEKLEEEVRQEIISDTTSIARIIREHHDVRVTDTLVEAYIDLASSKEFTVDPVVLDIRKTNKLTNIIEGKIDFVLNDGMGVALTEETLNKIRQLINIDEINQMKQSIGSFMNKLKKIEE